MTFVFDIDNTICERKIGTKTYADVAPFPEAIKALHKLKAEGHTIILMTARHMRTCQGNQGRAIALQGKILLDWLVKHNIPHDEIWWSKPHADMYIDDAAHLHTDWPSTLEAINHRIQKGPRTAENP